MQVDFEEPRGAKKFTFLPRSPRGMALKKAVWCTPNGRRVNSGKYRFAKYAIDANPAISWNSTLCSFGRELELHLFYFCDLFIAI